VKAIVAREMRRFQRLKKPLDGSWRGLSGAAPCRILDISWGGCFIQTFVEPTIRERTFVTLTPNGTELTLPGVVVYVEKAMGFAVQFDPLTPAQVDALKAILGDSSFGS
jgi:PilZ domain